MCLFRRSGFNCRGKRSSFKSSQMKFMCFRSPPPHTQSHTCLRTDSSAPEGPFSQSANSSGSQFVAIVFIITVMCWDDCEWRWECLFSCNCLFPTEISMSDPFTVLIITCLLFYLPAPRGGHHGRERWELLVSIMKPVSPSPPQAGRQAAVTHQHRNSRL